MLLPKSHYVSNSAEPIKHNECPRLFLSSVSAYNCLPLLQPNVNIHAEGIDQLWEGGGTLLGEGKEEQKKRKVLCAAATLFWSHVPRQQNTFAYK